MTVYDNVIMLGIINVMFAKKMMRMLLLSSSVNPDAYRVLTFNNESQFREIITAFVKRGTYTKKFQG
jgi:hypothetical protein